MIPHSAGQAMVVCQGLLSTTAAAVALASPQQSSVQKQESATSKSAAAMVMLNHRPRGGQQLTIQARIPNEAAARRFIGDATTSSGRGSRSPVTLSTLQERAETSKGS